MAEAKFYRQKSTGAIFTVVSEGPEGHEVCDNWEEIVAGSVDAAAEKLDQEGSDELETAACNSWR